MYVLYSNTFFFFFCFSANILFDSFYKKQMTFVSPFLFFFVSAAKLSIKIEGVKSFSFEELVMATNSFSSSSQVGQGGYGTVHKGILADKTTVAVKRAKEGSLQGQKEFLTEIELLSRLHHRNLVSLLGYCDEEEEQVFILNLYLFL